MANPNWCSPPWIVAPIRAFGRGVIDLDPCANAASIVGALTEWSGQPSGLVENWGDGMRRGGVAYSNPPYTRGVIDAWAAKLQLEGGLAILGDWHSIALLPLRTSAHWWQYSIMPSWQACCFPAKRITFNGAPSAVPWESVLVYWGSDALRFQRQFEPLGWVERRR